MLTVGTLAVLPVRPASAAPFTGLASRLHSLTEVTPTDPEHADHPALRLVSAMAPWSALEPTDQSFDWSQMDANVAAARAGGYRLLLRIMAGRAAPAWLSAAGAEQLTLLGTDPNADDYCDFVQTTLPWDPVLEQQYRELIDELGRWLSEDDGAGGRKGDHISLIPVSMPSYLGTEMVIGYGANATCPSGTEGAGSNLRTTNLARWNAISTEPERRTRTEQAWRDAIDIHMAELPPATDSVIAYGHVFNDGEAASLRIAADKVSQYAGRLWSMYTNLQPLVRSDGTFGPWREWCSACHRVMLSAIEGGGTIGFQTAADNRLDTSAKYHAAIEDALASYPLAFLETQPQQIDRYGEYLLGDPGSVQSRIAEVVDDVITSTFVSCEPATIGVTSTCTGTVSEFAGDGGEPGGVDALAWSSSGEGSFSSPTCSPSGGAGVSSCSVAYTPAPGASGTHTITADYAGDPNHFGSEASAGVAVAKRSTATAVACTPSSTVAGRSVVCTAAVDDASTGDAIAPGGSVAWTTTGSGSFTPASCSLTGSSPATCSVTFLPTSVGSHGVVATYAGDASHAPSGTSGSPATVSVTADQPPSVAITSPAANSNVPRGKTIAIAASASDDVGVVSVAFSVDGSVRCTDTTTPYTCSWTVPKKANVKHTLRAVAKDTASNTSSHSITVTAR